MAENKNNNLFPFFFGVMGGFASLVLIDYLLDGLDKREQLEDNIDAIDECLTDIKKLLKYNI